MRSRYKRVMEEFKQMPWWRWLNGVYWMLRRRTIHCWKSRADVAEEVYGYGTTEYWDAWGEDYNAGGLQMCMKRYGHCGKCDHIDGENIKITFKG